MIKMSQQQLKWYGPIVTVAVLVVAGVLLTLSQNSKHDKIVASDLSALNGSVQQYAALKRHLPFALDQLAMADLTRDRIVTNHYQYKIVDNQHYQLCARFTTSSSKTSLYALFQQVHHGEGNQCFSFSIPVDEAGNV